jgi:Ca2+-binding EF-hand superfamily protein
VAVLRRIYETGGAELEAKFRQIDTT